MDTYYGGSVSKALNAIYPELPAWTKGVVGDGYWNKDSNVRQFMKWLSSKKNRFIFFLYCEN